MGLFNIFSKKEKEVEKVEQIVEDYNTPVVEPVGQLPVSNTNISDNIKEVPVDFNQSVSENVNKFVASPIKFDQSQNEILFDDAKPAIIYTAEQQEYINNGYYLTPSYKTTDEFSFVNSDSENDSNIIDDELPVYDDDFNAISNSNAYIENNQDNQHKFFASSVDEIDNYKNELNQDDKGKTKILGDASIFGIARIDDERH